MTASRQKAELIQGEESRVGVLSSAYCVEKLVHAWISVNPDDFSTSNSLFLLGHVSAETSKPAELGVFQHNRPRRELWDTN
jgi:hypothetical protein